MDMNPKEQIQNHYNLVMSSLNKPTFIPVVILNNFNVSIYRIPSLGKIWTE